jgi:CheY-like chemotaxis protein
VQQISVAANRASGLTRQLLAFSRGQLLQPEMLDPNEVVAGLEPLLTRLIGEDIVLRVETDPDLGRVRADRGQLEQILMNLVVNARDAMPRGGVLCISTDEDRVHAGESLDLEPGRYVRVSVTDTGVGIDARALPRIFEPFFTTKSEGRGTGLGLSTAYGIARQSGGNLSVHSAPERGATFDLHLPWVDEAPDRAGPAERRDPNRPLERPLIVAVVEDDDAVRRLVCRALRGAGYRVLDAASGEEALGMVAAEPGEIDGLVTDIVMPGIDGLELSRRITELRPGIRVLYMSGYAEAPTGQPLRLPPEAVVIQKPFRPSDLDSMLRSLLTPA